MESLQKYFNCIPAAARMAAKRSVVLFLACKVISVKAVLGIATGLHRVQCLIPVCGQVF